MELESAHVNLNEDSNVQLCPTNHRAQGLQVVTIEELPEEGEVTRSESVLAPVTTETVHLTFSKGHEESTNPKDMQPSFPVKMMPFMGMTEQSQIAGLMAVKVSVAEVVVLELHLLLPMKR